MGIWWSWWGSNPLPPACKAGALPVELQPHIATYLCTDGVANHPLWFYSVLDQVLLRTRLLIRSCLNKRQLRYEHRRTFVATTQFVIIYRSPIASLLLVRDVGLEPTHLTILDPKSSASANSANPGYVWLWGQSTAYMLIAGHLLFQSCAMAYIYEKLHS